MARQQVVTNKAQITSPDTNPHPLSSVSLLVTSVIVQADPGNLNFIYQGDGTNQNMAIAPGKALVINGDNLDHGTTSLFDLNLMYYKAANAGDKVNIEYLLGY